MIPSLDKILNLNWYRISVLASFICKSGIVVLLFCILSTFTLGHFDEPYSYFISGILFFIGVLIIFSFIKKQTAFIHKGYNSSQLLTDNKQLILLLNNIHSDIQRYQASAYSYFLGVRSYKYITTFLSALSTIILGLNLEKTLWFHSDYPIYAKNAALIIGTIVTAYSALMIYWNVEKYWLINKTIANKLRALKDEIESLDKAQKLDLIVINEKSDVYARIKSDFYKYWEGALSEKDSQGDKGK